MNPAQRFRPPDGEQNRKIFFTFFLIARPQNFFQLRKRKFFCFSFLLTQELRKRFPTPFRLRRTGKRAKIHFPHTPFSFCPLAFGLRPIFLRTGYKLERVAGGVSSLFSFCLPFVSAVAFPIFHAILYAKKEGLNKFAGSYRIHSISRLRGQIFS